MRRHLKEIINTIEEDFDCLTMTLLSQPRFPHKLYEIVNDPKNRLYISWREGGFAIWNMFELCDKVLGKYCISKSPSTLRRQLTLYGFRAVYRNIRTGVIYYDHDDGLFIQGRPDLLDKMLNETNERRKKRTGIGYSLTKKRRVLSHLTRKISLSSSSTSSSLCSSSDESSITEEDEKPLWKQTLEQIVQDSANE